MRKKHMPRPIYCKGDNAFHYPFELPKPLQPYVHHEFSSGGYAGGDFGLFDARYHDSIKRILPTGYIIHEWRRHNYFGSATLKSPKGNFIYLMYPDVRYCPLEWFTNILYRTMKHEKDFAGGINRRTTLFALAKNIKELSE